MKNIPGFQNVFLKNILLDLISIQDENGKLKGTKITFNTIHEDKIYHKTNGQPVGYFPENLSIDLDMRALIKLNSLFLETISSYLYNIRSKVFEKDLIEVIHSRIDEKRFIKVRVSKFFFREEDKGRYKISIAIINKGLDEDSDDAEILNINFSKRDVVIFSSLLRTITSSYLRESSLSTHINFVDKETNEVVESKLGVIAKIDSSLLIDNVWLHGQELLNIMYTLDQLIYKLNIEKNLDVLNSFYRQIKFSRENDILYMHIKKMNNQHEEEPFLINGRECYIKLPMSSYLISTLFLFLDINILRHADFEDELQNTEILGSSKTYLGEKVKFHISMKESLLGIAIKPKTKTPDESRITFVGKTKDGQFNEENEYNDILENYIKKYNANGEKELVPVLSEFQIDLKDQWHKLISALGVAYTREYISEEKDWNLVKFFVVNQNNLGRFKYEFTIFADKNNKAPAVLIIDKYKQKKDNNDEFIARFRQPLFEKYIYQLLSIILTASEDVKVIDLIENLNLKSMLMYHYKSFKKIKEIKKDKKIEYGIKKHDDVIELGNFTQKNTNSILNTQDISLLNISSFFRLTKGYWIPFVGDKVAIGQDGHLTDMFGETNMEEDKKGSIWATKIFLEQLFKMNLKFTDKLRVAIYRKQLEEQKELSHLKDLSDEEILTLLNSTVIANAVDANNIRYALLFNLIFLDNQEKKERIITQIKRVIALEKNLSKFEKLVIKFGIIHGFSSNNYRKEMFRFIKTPLSLKSISTGNKFISSYKFKEIFYFAFNLIKRGRYNERPLNFDEKINPSIKNIYSLEQLLSSFLVADAIIEIREERKLTLNKMANKNIPPLEVKNEFLNKLYHDFAKLVGYRYPFLYMAKIGFEDMVKYKFFESPSVVLSASNDTNHLNSQFGANYSILSKVNLFDHTANVFNQALMIGEGKGGRVMQIAIPILGCLFHDFGKCEKLRNELVGTGVGKVYKAHAEVSSMYIKEIMATKYHKLLNEQPLETIDMLANSVANHHPNSGKQKSDTTISFIIEADNKARKEEFKQLQLELKKP